MKRTIITTGIIVVLTVIALVVFNKLTSRKSTSGLFTEASSGRFEITISTTGELIAENSVVIKAPEISQGRDIQVNNIRITDMIPEGTEVKEGDWIATLDRSLFDNSLKDARDRLATMQTDLQTLLLDTALSMNSIRDQVTNQKHIAEEAEITFRNSKFEPPTTLRQAEINLDQAKRILEQLERSYTLREAQTRLNVRNRRLFLSRIERRIKDYEEVLAGFEIKAPSEGMVIYKRDRLGRKVKAGMSINVMDRVVATLPDLSSMLSKVYVSEVEISKVKPGQSVTITIDAFPQKSFSGVVKSVANIGEKLPNSDSKVFEVQVKVDGSDFNLRPSMTTNNKIVIKTFDNVTFIPIECVHTGSDSIPFVYTKSGLKQVVSLGDANEKDVVVNKGLEPGTELYLEVPPDANKFRLTGQDVISGNGEHELAEKKYN